MSRFLFVVPPLTGHIHPTLGVAAELKARGHQVAWVGHPGKLRGLLPPDARIHALSESMVPGHYQSVTDRARTVRGLAALKFLWEDFLLPLARSMVPGVEDAITAFGPDVLVVDQQAIAGAIAARRLQLPWATFSTTSAGVVHALRDLPKVQAWIDEELANLMGDYGLEELHQPDLSPHLVTVFSTKELAGTADGFPPHYALVGPALGAHRADVDFPWEALDDRPKVYASLGTVNAERGERFYQALVDALRDEPVQVILSAPTSMIPAPPPNFIVRDYVPQLSILEIANVVITHAGHNTVCESLSHGCPLVMLPITDDQPVVAQQVVDAGAGIRLKFHRVRAEPLRDAVRQALTDPRLMENAQRICRSFERAGGAAIAADRLEVLA